MKPVDFLAVLTIGLVTSAASAQTALEKLDAATQYVDGFSLPGKSGREAMQRLNAEGFKTCRYAGGVLTTMPPDEPVLYCVQQDQSKLGCTRTFSVTVQMDWGGRKLTVPEMLKEMQTAPVQKVTTLCL